MPERILVASDEKLLQEWLIHELNGTGYQADPASTGPVLLETAQTSPPPSLILLDVDLSGPNSYSIAGTLRSRPETADIPIIFLLNALPPNDRLSFEVDYLLKPLNRPELLARVKNTLHWVKERDKAWRDLETYKSNLVENMSHELMTPLAKVLNGVDILTRQTGQQHLTEFNPVIETIRSGADELRWLLEDLLLANQLTGQRIGSFRQPIDLVEAAKVIIKQTEAKYRRKNLTIELIAPKRWLVNIQRKHLYHILHHLLDNAGKFSLDSSQPQISLQPVGQAGAIVEVQDFGLGIEPELLEKVFDKFYQVDMSMTRGSGGMGLGLYLARALARLYGGEVTLTSQAGTGTTCRWFIPDVAPDWEVSNL